MQSLSETIKDFKSRGIGIGHFNISDSNQLHAVANAAKQTKLPVIVGLSEGERDFFPLLEVRKIIDIYQEQGVQVYLNADHTYSVEKVQEAISSGVDSVVIDGAKLPFEENIHMLKTCVKYARASGREVLMEGELGYIGTSSNVLDKLPEGAVVTEELMTKPEDLKRLVEESGIDLAAPAVGNIHGIITSGQPKLSISRITQLRDAVSVPIVLHGGSGSPDEEFVEAIKAGITIIHINTDIRLIYRDTLKKTLADSKDVAPYKFIAPSVEEMRVYVVQKLQLFGL